MSWLEKPIVRLFFIVEYVFFNNTPQQARRLHFAGHYGAFYFYSSFSAYSVPALRSAWRLVLRCAPLRCAFSLHILDAFD